MSMTPLPVQIVLNGFAAPLKDPVGMKTAFAEGTQTGVTALPSICVTETLMAAATAAQLLLVAPNPKKTSPASWTAKESMPYPALAEIVKFNCESRMSAVAGSVIFAGPVTANVKLLGLNDKELPLAVGAPNGPASGSMAVKCAA